MFHSEVRFVPRRTRTDVRVGGAIEGVAAGGGAEAVEQPAMQAIMKIPPRMAAVAVIVRSAGFSRFLRLTILVPLYARSSEVEAERKNIADDEGGKKLAGQRDDDAIPRDRYSRFRARASPRWSANIRS